MSDSTLYNRLKGFKVIAGLESISNSTSKSISSISNSTSEKMLRLVGIFTQDSLYFWQ